MKIGFIGLGNQGKPLARNLVDAGHDLIVHDIRQEPVDELVALGAAAAASPRQLGRDSEIIQICVVDDQQLQNVLLGSEGVLADITAGSIIVVHSTVSPSIIQALSERAAARKVELIDAPVSGGEHGAINKTMSFMVGGSAAALAKCRPLFEASGSNITHTGGLGTGIRAKIVHQTIACGNMLAAYEGMRLGLEAGLSKDVLKKIIHDGGAQSFVADNWFDLALRPRAIPLFAKDLKLSLKLAEQLGLSLPGAILAQDLIEEIVP